METITNEEAAAERDRIRKESSEKADKEFKTDSQRRADEIAKQNEFKKKQRDSAQNVLESGTANKELSEVLKAGGSLGRRLEIELRRFERTGRVSNWLAGETLKAESAQNAAQQSAFRQAVADVISTQYSPLELTSPSEFSVLGEKPQLSPQVSGGGGSTRHPFKISSIAETDNHGNLTGSYVVTINTGTINGILPSGILNDGSLQSYNVGASLKYIVLTATASAGQITSGQINVQNSAPEPQEPAPFSLPTQAKFLLGVTFGGSVFQIVYNNLNVGGKLQYTESRVAGVGELPYTTYYVWG